MSEPAGPGLGDGSESGPGQLARAYAVCAGCIGTGVLFFLGGVVPLPVLLYFPLSRRFGLSPQPPELAMDFYGRSLLALGAGLLAALATYAVARWLEGRRSAAAPAEAQADADADADADAGPADADAPVARGTLATAYAATALLLAAGLWAYQLYARQPSPEPLPPGYFLRCPPARPGLGPSPSPASASTRADDAP